MIESGAVTAPNPIGLLFTCLAEEREHSACCSISQRRLASTHGWPSRRPRSPSSNHNVKEPALSTNFHSARDETPPARLGPTGGEARCIRGRHSAVKRIFQRFKAFFDKRGRHL